MPNPGHPDNSGCVEQYIWSVIYRDGSVFQEYPSPTVHHSFTEVDIGRVAMLSVAPNHWINQEGTAYAVPVSTDERPVMFRRVSINTETGVSTRVHIFGTQQTVRGSNVKRLLHIVEGAPSGVPVILAGRDLDL